MPMRSVIGTSILCSLTARFVLACLVLTLAACGTTPVPEVRFVSQTLPESLLSCTPAPELPHQPSWPEVARFLIETDAAGTDCRDKLARVRGLVRIEGVSQDTP